MKRKVIITAVIIIAVLLAAGISLVFFKPLFYRYFFNSDRISGTVRVAIDGEDYDLKDGDVTGSHEGADIGIEYGKLADGAEISTRGGDYGPYMLSFHVGEVTSPLTVVVYQYNWWNVTEFDLTISIDTAAKKITFNSQAKVIGDSVFGNSEEHSAEFGFSDQNITHYIVSV